VDLDAPREVNPPPFNPELPDALVDYLDPLLTEITEKEIVGSILRVLNRLAPVLDSCSYGGIKGRFGIEEATGIFGRKVFNSTALTEHGGGSGFVLDLSAVISRDLGKIGLVENMSYETSRTDGRELGGVSDEPNGSSVILLRKTAEV
jgi:hypothetical protein